MAAVSVAAVQLMNQLGAACSIDKVIIGGIILLVLGIALTNGVRDIAGAIIYPAPSAALRRC